MANKNDGDPPKKGVPPTEGETPGGRPVDAPTARRRQEAIGRRLRQMYEEVVSEPVPDDFMSFLKQADNAKDPGRGGKSPTDPPTDT